MLKTTALAQRSVVPVGRGPVQLCVADDGGTIVALASGSNQVTLLDGQTSDLRATVDVGEMPLNAVSSRSLVYVMSNAVQVLDVPVGRIRATVRLPAGSRPKNAVLAVERDRLYSLNTGNATVSEIDLNSNQVARTVEVGRGPHYGQRWKGALFVANGESSDVAVVDESTFSVIGRVQVGTGPERCVIYKDYAQVYTNNVGDDTISIIDIATLRVVATVAVDHEPFRITPWNSRGRNEWAVLCREGSIVFVDSETHKVTDRLQLSGTVANWNWGPGPHHQRVLVAMANEPVLLDVDASRLEVVGEMKLTALPEPAGYGPGVALSNSGGVFVACVDGVALLSAE